jgi:hypothetical protein
MAREEARAKLRDILAYLYPSENDARRVVNDAGLNEQRIAFSGTSVNTWHSILREAENTGQIDGLFDVVLHEFGTNDVLVQAIDGYRGQGTGISLDREKQKLEPSAQSTEAAITILFLAANPRETPWVRLDAQSRAIDQALRDSAYRGRFRLEKHFAVRVSDLAPLLLRYKPTIVHFTGHGSRASKIALEDEAGGIHAVSPQALSRLFSVLKDDIRCVVLMACYSEGQAQAIAEHIDCVVGTSDVISESAAIRFAASFYLGLGYGRDVKTAFDLGCVELELENIPEEHIPKLVATKADPSRVVLVSPA